MQLSEAIIWYGIDHKNKQINKNGTSFGKYLLATHNIGIGIGIILSILFINKSKLTAQQFIPLLMGIIFFFYIVIVYYLPGKYPDETYPLNKSCDKSCQNPSNRLLWRYPHSWYAASYLISVIIMFIWIKPMSSKILLMSFFSITFGATFFVNPKTVGSVWCFSTSFLTPLIVVANYFLIRNLSSDKIMT